MHILHIHLKIKPERVEEFIAATVENAKSSIHEPGCLRFDVIQDAADASHFELIEIYRDQAAHAAHRESPHYTTWAGRAEPMMAEPRQRTVYLNIFPPDDSFNK